MLGVFLVISILINLYLGYIVYTNKQYIIDLEEECNNLEDKKDEIEKEALNYYKMGNQKLKTMEEELSKEKIKNTKLEKDLEDTNKKLDISITERLHLEKENERLNNKLNLEKESSKMEEKKLESKVKQEDIKEENIDLINLSKEELLNYFKNIDKLILNNDNERLSEKIKEIREYEEKTEVKTKKIITKQNKLSYKNLLLKIEELENKYNK